MVVVVVAPAAPAASVLPHCAESACSGFWCPHWVQNGICQPPRLNPEASVEKRCLVW